ncbi:N-acetylmuramic acid 6-phosphate etherase [Martelella endophytica]|uniref:N-acetylmuramic acid 6-phosphate etherase n=1 Tax=Martelella endophytica TaxID=1486262 RepID=A0A0D5LQ77_MAREN|nr:N-acetylmuramic acid 6-phosphate etherase [Martelella endophytica]AJY45483.1 N-acetylmuramic acid-6-phosphate etherase [Martelella endophytica]
MNSTTEAASKRYATIDKWPAADLVDGIVEGQFAAIAAVSEASPIIAAAADAICERLENGGRLIYMGAGTSGRLATLDAAELPPTYNFPRDRALSLMAGGPEAFLVAKEGAEDDEAAAVTDLESVDFSQKDVLVGVAASGNTPYVVSGLAHARALRALTVAVFNNPQGSVAGHADFAVLLSTGAEFVAGSTRMKAGTAQKVALNTLSTAVMIRLGYVYQGRMVEMKPTNAKLHQRAKEMVAELADTDIETAARTLSACDNVIKTAIVMLNRDLDRGAAEAKLAAAKGNLRRALES